MSRREQKQRLHSSLQRLGVDDARVLSALGRVNRELFIPLSHRSKAYEDAPQPIGEQQTISQPSLVAYMTESLDVHPEHRVLEIGTGSGYQTALLAELCGQVYSVEVRADLSAQARETLDKAGYRNIQFRVGDGTEGWPEFAPFDRIMVTAAAKEVPQPLVAQLKVGGRMVIPVDARQDQDLFLLMKDEHGAKATRLMAVRFVPIVHEDPKTTTKPPR
ncbi:MAG TPA: protein-L-isoaspartate(D-aspartate) O-methyltransferase [Bdellovibrionales bacterium]|nr:protein-L-isoaspartate(D-aspartate) O-methyltransferase [Bdellovibrionales bacterium]